MKLEKANEKLKKSLHKWKRSYSSDSDDCDSSWRGGSGSTWGRNCRKSKFTSNSQLDGKPTPCPSKATDTLISKVTSKLMNKAANSDQILECLTAYNKNSDLINNVIWNELPSPTQNILQQNRKVHKYVRQVYLPRRLFKPCMIQKTLQN